MGNIRKAAFVSLTPVLPKTMWLLDATIAYKMLGDLTDNIY
jgi:hypothetical protein